MALNNSALTGNENGGILAKLAKIKELKDNAGTQAEAEAAAAMLQKLLINHKLEMSDIEAVELNRDEPVEKEYLEGSEYGFQVRKRVAWLENLASVVAGAHFCRILVSTGSNTVVFVGRKSDREVAKRIFIYLAAAARQLVEKEANDYKQKFVSQFDWVKPDIRGFKASFLDGFVNKISERYRLQRHEMEAAAKLAAEGEARAKREIAIENAVIERAQEIEEKVMQLIDETPIPDDLDTLVTIAQQAVEAKVREEFTSKPLDVNPMALVRLKTAEKDVEDWFQSNSSKRGGNVVSVRGVRGYRRTHSHAGYSRGQAQGNDISMSGNVLK